MTTQNRLVGARRSLIVAWIFLISVLIAPPGSVHAADSTWDGDTNGDFTNTNNWDAGVPGLPGAANTDSAFFYSDPTFTTVTIDSGRDLTNLRFNLASGAYRFFGGPLTIRGQVSTLEGTANTQTFDSGFTLATGDNAMSFNLDGTNVGSALFNGSLILNGDLVGSPNTNSTFAFDGQGVGILVRGTVQNGAGGNQTSLNADFNGSAVWLKGVNTHTGTSNRTRGTWFFESVSVVGGAASSFGMPTTVANGTFTIGSTTAGNPVQFIYLGTDAAGHTTDRNITNQNSSNIILDASGAGALVWNGSIANTVATGGAKSLILGGVNTDENVFGGAMTDNMVPDPDVANSLVKLGRSTWNLTGANTFTGTTSVRSGLLRLDFSNSGATDINLINPASVLNLQGGQLAFKGAAGEVNSQAFASTSLELGESLVAVANNGATSTTVNLGTITRSGVGAVLNIQTTAGGVVNQTGGTTTNDVLTNGGVAYATAGGGSDWAALSGSSIVVLPTYETSLNPADWAVTENVSINANPSANIAASQTINTLRVAGTSTTTIDPGQVLTAGAGGILFTGTGVKIITGGSVQGAGVTTRELVVFQNDIANTATISSLIIDNGGATALTKAGQGTLAISADNKGSGYTGQTTIAGGVLRLDGTSLGDNNTLNLDGGVLGLGFGDLTLGVGTGSVGGQPRVNWSGSGGFAAYGADRTVTLNTSNLTWGSTGSFLQQGEALILGAADADAKITLAAIGTINMGNSSSSPALRTIQVDDGSASIDAEISAVLALSYTVGGTAPNQTFTPNMGGLQKTGAGTLALSAANTYTGPTLVQEGTLLLINDASIHNSFLTEVYSGATLGGNGTTAGIEVNAGGSIAPGLNGIGTIQTAQTGNSDFTWDGEDSGTFAQMKFDLSTANNTSDLLNLGDGYLRKGGGMFYGFDFLAGGKLGETYTLIEFASTDFILSDFSYENLASGLSGNFLLNSDSLQFEIIPEPSVGLLLTVALVGLGIAATRRRCGSTRLTSS